MRRKMPVQNSAKLASYDYGILRFVPAVERGEFLNVGVILFCRTGCYLDARVIFQRERIQALAPMLGKLLLRRVEKHINQFPKICAGAGPIGRLEQADRFHWLVAPRSTIIQVSPVHSGLCDDPEEELKRLFECLVLV